MKYKNNKLILWNIGLHVKFQKSIYPILLSLPSRNKKRDQWSLFLFLELCNNYITKLFSLILLSLIILIQLNNLITGYEGSISNHLVEKFILLGNLW